MVAVWAMFVFALAFALPPSAFALAGRTFVASNGNDANTATNCARTAPCQTFAAAYGVTTIGGEVIALDSAGYGPLTITNSVSIIGIQRAFIKPPPSTTGITINAGSSGKVLLDNIEINGAGGASTTGIAVNSGHLILKNSVVTQLTTGLSIANTKADIVTSDLLFNTTGIFTSGTGTDPNGGGGGIISAYGPTQARLYGGNVMGNDTGFFMADPGAGISTPSKITILVYNGGDLNTHIVGNTLVIDGSGDGCPGGTNVFLVHCTLFLFFTSPQGDQAPLP
jgi:hypothetical protein